MFRLRGGELEVLLVHPGGPWWSKKDVGAWSVPKGEVGKGEEPRAAAQREFQEELGLVAQGQLIPLGEICQQGGKLVHAWALEGDCDPAALHGNTFSMMWPPRSGQWREFPEVDRAEFFSLSEARRKINPAQAAWLDRLAQFVARSATGPRSTSKRGAA
jgi:predicted NUDIX family NTP pyrophosphohydrolase